MPETKPSTSLATMMKASLPEVMSSLPMNFPEDRLEQTAKRFNRVALTAVRMDDSLQVCDFRSIVGCVIQAASLGLELNGVMGQAYMIPYNNNDKNIVEAQFQLGYQGMVNLVNRHQKVAVTYAEVVKEGDEFEYKLGTDPYINHVPKDHNQVITHAYAVIGLVTGKNIIVVWTTDQINQHLKHFSQAYKKGKGPAADPYSWPSMAKKTVFLQASKWAPKSIEAQKAIVQEDVGHDKSQVITDEDVDSDEGFDITEEEQKGLVQDAEFEEEKAPNAEPAPPEKESSKPKTREDYLNKLKTLLETHLEQGHLSKEMQKGVLDWIDQNNPTAIEIQKKIQSWDEYFKRSGH